MLFDFKSYIEELRENNEKKEVIEKFEKFFGPIEGDLKEQNWFTEYVSKFKPMNYKVPEELKEDFDWDLLIQLVASSFSSDGVLDFSKDESEEKEESNESEKKENPEFVISVQSGDQVVVKKVSELWGFQILRLYEIYIEEQMNLQILIAEDEKEKEAILAQRDAREHRWGLVLDNLEKNKLEAEEKKEKEEKLGNLYDQL